MVTFEGTIESIEYSQRKCTGIGDLQAILQDCYEVLQQHRLSMEKDYKPPEKIPQATQSQPGTGAPWS